MSAEVVPQVMDEAEARRVTERIRYCAMGVRDGVEKLQALVKQAQEGSAHLALGYASWTAYLADVMGDEPLQLRSRGERREVASWLSGQGMSTRAIASVTGASKNTVTNDLRQVSQIGTPAPTTSTAAVPGPVAQGSTSEQAVDGAAEVAAPGPQDGEGRMGASTADGGHADNFGGNRPAVTGLDGKTYQRPTPKAPRRRPITDQARDAGYDLRKLIERIQRIAENDRFPANKKEVTAHLRGHLMYAVEVCQDLLDHHVTHDVNSHEGA